MNHLTCKHYQGTHPEYDNAEAFDRIAEALKPFGFVDTSWGNDTCPSLGLCDADGNPIIRVWIDYLTPEWREADEVFCVNYATDPDDHLSGNVQMRASDTVEAVIADAIQFHTAHMEALYRAA